MPHQALSRGYIDALAGVPRTPAANACQAQESGLQWNQRRCARSYMRFPNKIPATVAAAMKCPSPNCTTDGPGQVPVTAQPTPKMAAPGRVPGVSRRCGQDRPLGPKALSQANKG